MRSDSVLLRGLRPELAVAGYSWKTLGARYSGTCGTRRLLVQRIVWRAYLVNIWIGCNTKWLQNQMICLENFPEVALEVRKKGQIISPSPKVWLLIKLKVSWLRQTNWCLYLERNYPCLPQCVDAVNVGSHYWVHHSVITKKNRKSAWSAFSLHTHQNYHLDKNIKISGAYDDSSLQVKHSKTLLADFLLHLATIMYNFSAVRTSSVVPFS